MQRIIFFDGECNFCDSSVNFIIKKDKKALFKFISLQDERTLSYIEKYNIKENVNSFVLLDSEKIYYKSTAALKICKKLDGGIKLLYVFIIIPPFIRNIFYDIIAKNRYKWFGKKDVCMIPSKDIRDRFL